MKSLEQLVGQNVRAFHQLQKGTLAFERGFCHQLFVATFSDGIVRPHPGGALGQQALERSLGIQRNLIFESQHGDLNEAVLRLLKERTHAILFDGRRRSSNDWHVAAVVPNKRIFYVFDSLINNGHRKMRSPDEVKEWIEVTFEAKEVFLFDFN